MKNDIQDQIVSLNRIYELLRKHGEFQWAEGFSEILKKIDNATSAKEKKRIIRRFSHNLPCGNMGITDVYFQRNGILLREDSMEFHKNLNYIISSNRGIWKL